jgi:hypothetical protein
MISVNKMLLVYHHLSASISNQDNVNNPAGPVFFSEYSDKAFQLRSKNRTAVVVVPGDINFVNRIVVMVMYATA